MNNLNKLYAVNYCESHTLKDVQSIRTHSLLKAIEYANYLKDRDNVLYAQIVTYVYNERIEFYEFIDLKNFYK